MPEASLSVIRPDGSVGTLTARQQTLLEAAQTLLRVDPHFQRLDRPALIRAEVNEGLVETQPGYLYLRYDVPGAAPQELWVHHGPRNRIAWTSGQVTVRET